MTPGKMALILAGHGSHLDPNSSAAVHAHAARIRAGGRFGEVRAAFWKEEPALSRALDGVDAEDVTIVPVFVSDGYFTGEVVPREMRLDGRLTERCGQRIRYTPPVGCHAALAEAVVARAEEAGAGAETAVVVLGHGTPRNPRSEGNVYAQADRVRASGRFAEVATLFIDQEPRLETVFAAVAAPEIVVAPLFIADGWHVGQTIPDDLALDANETRREGRKLRYAAAAGTHPVVAEVILQLAEEAKQ